MFLATVAPASARQPTRADLDADTGRVRLSYRRVAEVFKDASNRWALHQYGTPGSRIAEAGLQLPMRIAKSYHTSLAIYAKPTFDAVAAATAAIDPATGANQWPPRTAAPTGSIATSIPGYCAPIEAKNGP